MYNVNIHKTPTRVRRHTRICTTMYARTNACGTEHERRYAHFYTRRWLLEPRRNIHARHTRKNHTNNHQPPPPPPLPYPYPYSYATQDALKGQKKIIYI